MPGQSKCPNPSAITAVLLFNILTMFTQVVDMPFGVGRNKNDPSGAVTAMSKIGKGCLFSFIYLIKVDFQESTD